MSRPAVVFDRTPSSLFVRRDEAFKPPGPVSRTSGRSKIIKDKHKMPPSHSVSEGALVTHIEEKAYRFAASPREGYLAGYCPHTEPTSLRMDNRLVRVRRWTEKLAWLYAVAEQDIPAGQCQWELAEHEDGFYGIVIDRSYPA